MSKLPSQQTAQVFGSDVAPNFSLRITGKDDGVFDYVKPLVSSVTFEEDEEMSSKFELLVVNHPHDTAGSPIDWRAVIDAKPFQEGNFIDLWAGYGNSRTFIDRVEIVKWLPDFPNGGVSTFKITGYDGRHKMQHENKRRAGKKQKHFYRNLPDEQIVKEIAKKYGFDADVDPTVVSSKETVTFSKGKTIKKHVIPTRIQTADTDDWTFLQKLAQINRFDLWVDFDRRKDRYVVHFKRRPDTAQPIYTFGYNRGDGSLLSATPDFSVKDQSTDVEVLYFDRHTRSVQLTVISDNNKSEDVKLGSSRYVGQLQARQKLAKGARVRFTAFGQTIDAFSSKPFRSKKEAQNFVQVWLAERERDLVILSGQVIGLPDVRVRQVHEFVGMSRRLDGFYRLTNVKHKEVVGSSYICEFTAHKILSDTITKLPSTRSKATTGQVVTKNNRRSKFGAAR